MTENSIFNKSGNIRQLLYVSRAKDNISKYDIFDILQTSIKQNENHDVSGFLVFHREHFMQVIEGSNLDIEKLINNIKKDNRHHNVVVILDHFVEKRDFVYWVMGFKNLDEYGNLKDNPHVFGTDILQSEEARTKAIAVLKGFIGLT